MSGHDADQKPLCPECHGDTHVYDTRGSQRWRECLEPECGVRFITSERFERRVRKYKTTTYRKIDNRPNI